MRTGEKVTKLTKKVGQTAPIGRIVHMRGDSVEVKWDDGHTSLISRIAVVPVRKK